MSRVLARKAGLPREGSDCRGRSEAPAGTVAPSGSGRQAFQPGRQRRAEPARGELHTRGAAEPGAVRGTAGRECQPFQQENIIVVTSTCVLGKPRTLP